MCLRIYGTHAIVNSYEMMRMINRESLFRFVCLGFGFGKYVWCWCGVMWLLWPAGANASNPLSFRGYAESRYAYLGGIDLGKLCEGDLQDPLKQICNDHLLYNRIRPSMLFRFGRQARLRTTLQLTTTHFRLDREIKSIEDILSLERFYFELRTKYVDVWLGKQSFNWGATMLWSLTTPYTLQDPTDFNAELPGLWSISANISYSATGGVRLGIMAAPDFQSTIEFVRWGQTFGSTQLAATFVANGEQNRLSFGAELKSQFHVGFWIEAALHVPYSKDPKGQEQEVSFAAAVGVDYTFGVLDGLYVAIQYYYNHSGLTDPAKYPFKSPEGLLELAKQFQSTGQGAMVSGLGMSGLGTFLAAHYLLLTARLSIMQDLNVSVTALGNLIDPSVMLGPFASWTFLTDFNLTIGAYFFLGADGSELHIGKIKIPLPGLPEDGIRLSPIVVAFAWLKYNF